jgi:hypothetical protein
MLLIWFVHATLARLKSIVHVLNECPVIDFLRDNLKLHCSSKVWIFRIERVCHYFTASLVSLMESSIWYRVREVSSVGWLRRNKSFLVSFVLEALSAFIIQLPIFQRSLRLNQCNKVMPWRLFGTHNLWLNWLQNSAFRMFLWHDNNIFQVLQPVASLSVHCYSCRRCVEFPALSIQTSS